MDTNQDEIPAREGWVFTAAIRWCLARLGIWGGMTLLLALLAGVLAMPAAEWMEGTVGSRYAPGQVSAGLDTVFRADHGGAMGRLSQGQVASAVVLQVLALLLGVFAAGGWLQVTLERKRGKTLRRFLFGGSRYFLRYLRVALLALAVIAIFRWTLYGLPWKALVLDGMFEVPKSDWSRLESLDSELLVRRLGWIQDGSMALLFALTMAWAVYTRTRLALHDSRSVLWAGGCTALSILRHPIQTLRPLILLLFAEALVVVGICGLATDFFDGRLTSQPSTWWVLALGGTGFFALAWREILRGARYHAAVSVSRQVVKPTLRPDPWRVIGGPGGPQYPVDDDLDERYGVAL